MDMLEFFQNLFVTVAIFKNYKDTNWSESLQFYTTKCFIKVKGLVNFYKIP